MKIEHLFAALLVSTLAGCDGDPSDPLVLDPGGTYYLYEAYAPTGAKVLSGVIHLQWPDVTIERADRNLMGTWTITWVAGADTTLQVGPQVGSGTLDGTAGDEGVVLSLNPAMMDSNVFLHAIVDGNTIRGTWTWSTVAGPTIEGRFTAAPSVLRIAGGAEH